MERGEDATPQREKEALCCCLCLTESKGLPLLHCHPKWVVGPRCQAEGRSLAFSLCGGEKEIGLFQHPLAWLPSSIPQIVQAPWLPFQCGVKLNCSPLAWEQEKCLRSMVLWGGVSLHTGSSSSQDLIIHLSDEGTQLTGGRSGHSRDQASY